jgi:hypothetical protein
MRYMKIGTLISAGGFNAVINVIEFRLLRSG